MEKPEVEEEKPVKKVNQKVVKKVEQTDDIEEEKPAKKVSKPVNQAVKQKALKKNITIT